MKLPLLILAFLFSAPICYSQNTDWVHAPINPVPRGADLAYENLQGAIFQLNILNYYTPEGHWFPYDGNRQVQKDAQGRVIQFKEEQTTYQYTYDTRGNLIEDRIVGGSIRKYTYDAANRLVQDSYTDSKKGTRTSVYSYEQKGGLCIITEMETNFDGVKQHKERHFTNGLHTYTENEGFPATRYQYKFDSQGNWISRTLVDAETLKPLINKFDGKPLLPYTREIIYQSEYAQGIQALTVVMTDLTEGRVANARLIPTPYINGKRLKKQLFSRFLNDYVLYDPLSQTYYVARDAYLKTYTVGQKLPVERLLTGAAHVLLYNGEKIKVLENGSEGKSMQDWNVINYASGLGTFIAINKKENRAYGFLHMPTVTDGKVVAVPGTPITGLWYMPSKEKKDVYLFENGEYVKGKYAMVGTLANKKSLNLVISVDGTTTYVFPDYDKAVEKQFYQARLFNPATDALKDSNSTPTPPANKTNTSTGSKANYDLKVDYGDIPLGDEARTFLVSYHTNPDAIAQHVTDIGLSIQKQHFTGGKQYPKFLEILKDIYTANSHIAFKVLMVVDKKSLDYCLEHMPEPMKKSMNMHAKIWQSNHKK